MGYPDTQGFAYSFARGELTLDRIIFTGISNVSADQPTEEGVVMGTRPYPLARTVGSMGLGEGSITFSDEAERERFIAHLGNAWREKIFTLSWVLTSPGRPNIRNTCEGCRLLSEPLSHESGSDALGGDITFSFMVKKINGKVPHSGMPALTR